MNGGKLQLDRANLSKLLNYNGFDQHFNEHLKHIYPDFSNQSGKKIDKIEL